MPIVHLIRREPNGACTFTCSFTPHPRVRALPRSDGRYAISVIRRTAVELAAAGYPDMPFSAVVVGIVRGQLPSFGRTEQEAAERCARGFPGGE